KACRDAITAAATVIENVTRRLSQSRDTFAPSVASDDIAHELRETFTRSAGSRHVRRQRNRLRFGSQDRRVVSDCSTSAAPTWTHDFVCVGSTDYDWCPSPKQRSDLSKIGLGERKIRIPIGSTSAQVHEQLLDEFPKLSEGGGYEICRAFHGSRRMVPISCPSEGYSQPFLKAEAGQAKLYIRPLQNNLETTPAITITTPSEMASTISAINNAPKEICGQCHVEIPFSLLKEHIETCKGLDIDDEESDGGVIESPARSTSTMRQTSNTHRCNHSNDQSQTISARNCNTTTSSSTSLSMAFNRSYSQIFDSAGCIESQEDNVTEEENTVANNTTLYPRCTLEYAVTLLSHHVVDRIHMDYNKDNGDDYDYQNYQRVNILRSTFWKTAVRAINRPDFLPNKLIKVSFIGESAVDDGGPRREFCSLLINSVKTCGVLEGKENNLSFSHDLRFLAERRYFTAGKMVAISLCHGGPGLHCLSQATFQYMARGCVEQPIAIDEIPDYDIQLIAKQIQSSETNEELRIAVSRIGEESVANITGFTDPMSTITLDMKAPILVNLTTHHCVYKSIPEINQFLDGMNVLHIADLVKAEP
ncbi:uncharacterized protein LOC102800801, partial [Saccoglossus kowalevskii]